MAGKKTGADLLDEEYDSEEEIGLSPSSSNETPFNQTVDFLAKTGGPQLELFCRSNKGVVEAAEVAYAEIYRFHSDYVAGLMNQIMRFTVSANGKGREELVQSLQAGAGVPDGYYEAQSASSAGFVPE